MKKRYLVLEDGTAFEGRAFGAEGAATGELIFTTGMGGYIETLTDPRHFGQIILQTFPLIGNFGVIESDFEGECAVRGYVVREWCDAPSNFRSQYDLDTFLKAKGVPGVCDLDTRALTRILRERGVMNAVICDEIPESLDAMKAYAVRDAVAHVTAKAPRTCPAEGEARFRVALVDYGAARSLIRALQKRGCEVRVVPASTPAAEILSGRPDGVVLSGGPGDPAENISCIGEIGALLGRVPLFGVGLGHQMAALALGGRTEKLGHGHHGANQPVRATDSARTFITTQSHGYAVVSESVARGRVSFVNADDLSCEGIDYPELKAFTLQFQPDGGSSPRDTAFLYDRFINLMEENRDAAE